MELQLEELEASATCDELAAEMAAAKTTAVAAFTRKRPARKPFPAHLPRERIIVPGPSACLCCGGSRLAKLGEDVTETLEMIPRQWKVIQYVREKFTCRDCEKISQAPAPFHEIPRGWAGPSLLAMIAFEKFGQHQPLNRQAERYAREGVPLSLSILADQMGAVCTVMQPIFERIEAHVFAAERLHGDDTTVPVLAKGKTDTGRCWTYVRDDRPFAGPAPPAAVFYYSRNRRGEHPQGHLARWAGVLQADTYGGYDALYVAGRAYGQIFQVPCWAHGRRKFFELADIAEATRRKSRGKTAVVSPIAMEAVKRIDAPVRHRTHDQRPPGGRTARRPPRPERAPCRRSAGLDARPARQAVAPRPRGQGARLHAHALAGVYPLPGRRPDLPDQQRRRASPARHRPRPEGMVVLRVRPRRPARGGHVQPDRTCKLNDVDPQAWLADVLARIAEHPTQQIDDLLPWNWRPAPPSKSIAA